ncbi:NDR1/HIN1-like protein 10 [Lolium perenne]|uniref:NDR1/HIN1-like protein 10 n=1 Tax=Lolium perenne TaxID=4522 RepID=UPI0021F5CE8A|nr:NDR1/HIN1-like protein 10 [Lolium perenne]
METDLWSYRMWTPLNAVFIIYWLSYRPDRFQPATDSAVLASFDLTNDSALIRYDLAVDLSFRNSHRYAISYLDVAASVFYNDTRLGPTDEAMPSFVQGRKNTTVLHPAFRGVVPVDTGVAVRLNRESAAGTLYLRVTVSLTLMYKVFFLDDIFFYKYDCWLWFPPPRNNTPALFSGDGTKCRRA